MSFAKRRRAIAGFTLLEVIFVCVLAFILVRIATMKMASVNVLTLPSQGQTLAAYLRRAQSMAVQRGMRVTVAANPASGVISITCNACNEAPLKVQSGVSISNSSAYFNSLGVPTTTASSTTPVTSAPSFTLTAPFGAASQAVSVTIAPLTGRVSAP